MGLLLLYHTLRNVPHSLLCLKTRVSHKWFATQVPFSHFPSLNEQVQLTLRVRVSRHSYRMSLDPWWNEFHPYPYLNPFILVDEDWREYASIDYSGLERKLNKLVSPVIPVLCL